MVRPFSTRGFSTRGFSTRGFANANANDKAQGRQAHQPGKGEGIKNMSPFPPSPFPSPQKRIFGLADHYWFIALVLKGL